MSAPSRVPLAWRTLRLLGDLAIGLVALSAAFVLRTAVVLPGTEALLPGDRITTLMSGYVWIAVTQLPILYFFGFYDSDAPEPRLERIRRLVLATGLQILLLIAFYFLTSPYRLLASELVPRSVLALYIPLQVVLLYAFRQAMDRLLRPPLRRVALVGAGRNAADLAEEIELHHWHGLKVIGWVPSPLAGHTPAEESPALGRCLGTIDDLPRLLDEGEIEEVILVTPTLDWHTQLLDSLGTAARRPSVLLLPSPFESLLGSMRYFSLHDVPLIEVLSKGSDRRIRLPLKRLVDLCLALPLTLVTLPVMVLAGLAVKLESPGPIFYRQERVGRFQQPFVLWKLRTMKRDAESETGEVKARLGDPRVVRVGRILRSLRIDELPQLFNVLAGHMSLVGPRPERPGFVRDYLDVVPGYVHRFEMLPGLTGLAQVHGDYHSTPQNKLRYELSYLANWSIWLDLAILVRTVKIVLTSRGI